MLDAYIIERIRRERERPDPGLRPLRIEVPRPGTDDRLRPVRDGEGERREDEGGRGRGVIIIDYSI